MKNQDNQSDLSQWLNQAGRYPLLSQEQVTLITRQIQALPDGHPKRTRLVNKIVRHNLRLVAKIVRSFMKGCNRDKWGSTETLDYLQVGVIGLIRAAEKYDPTRGYTFSTYANHWIRSKISRYNLKVITPVYVSEAASRNFVYYKRNGYLKSRRTGKTVKNEKVLQSIRDIEVAYCCMSLDMPCGEGNSSTLVESIADVDRMVDREYVYEQMHETMDKAGISAIGKEILICSAVYDEDMSLIASRLDISVSKAKREKKAAIELARANSEAFVPLQ